MTQPLGFGITEEAANAALRSQLERARAEEVAALSQAAALVRAHATQQEIDAAYRRCELARTRKAQLLESLGPGGAG